MKFFRALFFSLLFLGLTSPMARASDTKPPLLVDWNLIHRQVGISDSDAILAVKFILNDESPIELPRLLLRSKTTSQITEFANVTLLASSGNLYSYEAKSVIKKGQAPRSWEWILYPLRDVLGNQNSKFGPGDAWPAEVLVTDLVYTNLIANCERSLPQLNSTIERILTLEKDYPTYKEEVELIRFKYQIPATILTSEYCLTPKGQENNFYLVMDAISVLSEKIAQLEEKRLAKEQEVASVKKKSELLENARELLSLSQKLENQLKSDEVTRWLKPLQTKIQQYIRDLSDFTAVNLGLFEGRIFTLNAEFLKLEESARTPISSKSRTITCVKGKAIKRVTGTNPKCPSGYKVKR